MTRPFARFDDLRPHRRHSFALGPIGETIVAHHPAQVRAALEAAEDRMRQEHRIAGWVSYEAAPAFDPALVVRPIAGTGFSDLPLVWFGVAEMRTKVSSGAGKDAGIGAWRSLIEEGEHRAAVEEIRRRIRIGDTYQVNYTFLLTAGFEGDPQSYYQELIGSQSAGYGALLDTGDWVVASASPELFFEWRRGSITCRPMKGTARRGQDAASDEAARRGLQCSEKNRAENVMIVDMVRNDLGRIAEVGSVRVPALWTTEKYDTLWQLTSTITATPRLGVTLCDVFESLFPSASITGAPKVSTMEIISNLENHPRGVYCGAIGFGAPGREGPEWVFNVGIRTVLIDRRSGTAYYGTGGGITYDSEPGDEYAEAVLKTRVLDRQTGRLKLLETTRWDPDSGVRHLDAHVRRALASAQYFDIPLDPAAVRAAVSRAVRELDGAARVRVLIDRRGGITVDTSHLPATSGTVQLAIDDRPLDGADPLRYHKTTVRDVYEEAAARHPEADDVILWNVDGEVTETTIGNLAVRLDGAWLTPPVSAGLLPGTEREARLAAGELAEARITLDALRRATAIARLNSVRGWEAAMVKWWDGATRTASETDASA